MEIKGLDIGTIFPNKGFTSCHFTSSKRFLLEVGFAVGFYGGGDISIAPIGSVSGSGRTISSWSWLN